MVPTREIIADFDLRLRLARAAELTRAGAWPEAEALLVSGGVFPTTAAELDLLARIYTRQERFAEAEAAWQAALRVADADAQRDCQRALEVLRQHLADRQRRRKILLTVSVVLHLAFAVLIAWLILGGKL